MDCHTPGLKHCLSPLAAQRRSHTQAMCSKQADGSAFVSLCKRSFFTSEHKFVLFSLIHFAAGP